MIDSNNPVVKLCAAGMTIEATGDLNAAHALFDQAWTACKDDFDACIVAHFLARYRPPAERLYWNQIALDCAAAVNDERVQTFYPSLYLNLGWSYETLGDIAAAQRNYALAAQCVDDLPAGPYADVVRRGIAAGQKRVEQART